MRELKELSRGKRGFVMASEFVSRYLSETLAQWNPGCRRLPYLPFGLPGSSSFPQKNTESGAVAIFPALPWDSATEHSPYF